VKNLKWLVPALLALMLLACAKPPQAEIDSAKAQVARAAGDADVKAYAPDTLKRAQEALAKMEAELTAKKYDRVKAYAAEAQSAGIAAFADAKTGKERVRTQAMSLIDAVKKALPEAEGTYASVRRLRPPALDLAAAADTIAEAKATLAEAEQALTGGSYLSARDKAQDAQTALADLVQSMSEAVQASVRKK